MNQSALEGFVKIVEMDSFSAAAEALYLSQSALSQQIRTLEGQLQFELFQHVPRRVILTPAGRDFYPKAKQLTALYHPRGLRRQIMLARDAGEIILYAPGGYGGYFLPSDDPEVAQREMSAFYHVQATRCKHGLKAIAPVARKLGIPLGSGDA